MERQLCQFLWLALSPKFFMHMLSKTGIKWAGIILLKQHWMAVMQQEGKVNEQYSGHGTV